MNPLFTSKRLNLNAPTGHYVSFCIVYYVVAENHSEQDSPWDAGGLLRAHGLNTLTIWLNSRTCKKLQRYPFSCNISTIPCIIIIILCRANEKNILQFLFSETLHYSRKINHFQECRLVILGAICIFTRFSVWPIRSLYSGIWTTFDVYIIPYHNEDISGFTLRYGVLIRQWCINF